MENKFYGNETETFYQVENRYFLIQSPDLQVSWQEIPHLPDDAEELNESTFCFDTWETFAPVLDEIDDYTTIKG